MSAGSRTRPPPLGMSKLTDSMVCLRLPLVMDLTVEQMFEWNFFALQKMNNINCNNHLFLPFYYGKGDISKTSTNKMGKLKIPYGKTSLPVTYLKKFSLSLYLLPPLSSSPGNISLTLEPLVRNQETTLVAPWVMWSSLIASVRNSSLLKNSHAQRMIYTL